MTASTGEDREPLTAGSLAPHRPIPADTFSARLMLARMHAGHLSIREAADRCGLNYASWANWEQGKRPRDLLAVVAAISDGLEINHDWLLFGGPLTGPRGVPTSRKTTGPSGDTVAYPHRTKRPTPTHPIGRPRTGAPGAVPRRAVRVPTLVAA